MTDRIPQAVGRRDLLGISISAAGGIALSACGSPPPKPTPGQPGTPDAQDVPVTPPEDTVVFPALRDVLPPKEFRELAERFEDEEHQRFGPAGFQGVVEKVADIEKSLGVYDLSQFTPA